MHFIFRRPLILSTPLGIFNNIQCSQCKIRIYSQKNKLQPKADEYQKSSKYLYTIPPWMKKNVTKDVPKENVKNKQLNKLQEEKTTAKENDKQKERKRNKLKSLNLKKEEIINSEIKNESKDIKKVVPNINVSSIIKVKDEKINKEGRQANINDSDQNLIEKYKAELFIAKPNVTKINKVKELNKSKLGLEKLPSSTLNTNNNNTNMYAVSSANINESTIKNDERKALQEKKMKSLKKKSRKAVKSVSNTLLANLTGNNNTARTESKPGTNALLVNLEGNINKTRTESKPRTNALMVNLDGNIHKTRTESKSRTNALMVNLDGNIHKTKTESRFGKNNLEVNSITTITDTKPETNTLSINSASNINQTEFKFVSNLEGNSNLTRIESKLAKNNVINSGDNNDSPRIQRTKPVPQISEAIQNFEFNFPKRVETNNTAKEINVKKTGSVISLNQNPIKINDIVNQDITWAKGRLNEIRKKELGKKFAKSELDGLISNMGEDHIKRVLKSEETVGKNKISSPKKIRLNKIKDKVVLELPSNPMQFNSSELLYNSKERQQAKLEELKQKKIASLKIKLDNKLKDIDFKKKLFNTKVRKENYTDKKNNLNKLATLRNRNFNKKPKLKLYYNVSSQLQDNSKMMRFRKLKNDNTLRQLPSNKNNINLDDLKSRNWTNSIGENLQTENTQQNWLKNIKNISPKSNESQLKTNIFSQKCKKPIFISDKPIVKPKLIVNTFKNKENSQLNSKKPKPVFAKPSYDFIENEDTHVPDKNYNKVVDNPLYVVNSNTFLPENDKSKQPLSFEIQQNKNKSKENTTIWNKLLKFNSFKKTLKYFNKNNDTVEKEPFYNSQNEVNNLNKPSDNLNVSLLVTDKKKQPIYICDTCSYLFKYPNIYQRLHEKLKTFSHLIKNPKSINNKSNIISIIKSPIKASCNGTINTAPSGDEKQNKKKFKGKKKNTICCPKQSYSEVLSNFLKTQLHQK